MTDDKKYVWEKGYEKTWEQLREDDEKGLIIPIPIPIPDLEKKRKREDKVVRLGIIRHLNLVLDCSQMMLDQDLKPTRHLCSIKLIEEFVKRFLENNTISQLGIIATRNGRAEIISEMSSNTVRILQTFEKCHAESFCKGLPSLQNSLELAYTSMKGLPSYTSKEILIISGSLTLCDPGNINYTIQLMKKYDIRCSVIGLCAEMYVYKILCRITAGEYNVVLSDRHFQQLLLDYIKPRAATKNCEAVCVKMGFTRNWDQCPSFTTCMCHLKDSTKLNATGHFCPQCRSKCCDLPTQCKTCGISLVTSAHLVRPLHYLLPLPTFKEEINSSEDSYQCYACQKILHPGSNKVTVCEQCKQNYCNVCDDFIHNTLYVCPGCAVHQAKNLK